MKHIDYTRLSELFISERDKKIYNRIIVKRQLDEKQLPELYILNLLLGKELYLIISQLEKLFKYKFHQKMVSKFGLPNWFNTIEWSEEVLHILENKAVLLPDPVTPEHFWNELPLSFLKHLFDHEYVYTLFYGGIDTLFDNFPQRLELRRTTLKKIVSRAGTLKIDLIFGRIIISNRQELLRDYRKFMQFIYWLDKDYFFMTAKLTHFTEYYRLLINLGKKK
ncbi:MAG: hypothetical protein J6C85_02840 [Alphaproteobacteria bacterium]|nr:hypothetical protein [Alphaproteobacteria bacterium]